MGVSLRGLAIQLILLGVLCGIGLSEAAEPTLTPPGPGGTSGDRGAAAQAATEHASRARQLFSEQKYAEAAVALQRAYAYDAKPLYLFNAGTAYRKAEARKEALECYQRYLEVMPSGPLSAEARTHVSDLRALLAAQERLQGATQLLENERSQSQQKQEELQQALQKERSKPLYKRPWFIVTATVVGIAAAVAVGFAGYFQNKKQQSQIILQPGF